MIRIIGVGSPLGDDQAGWLVIKHLQNQVPEHVKLLTLDQPGATLINWMSGVDHLILVDALHCEHCHEPFRKLDVEAFDDSQRMLSSHGLDLGQTLQLAASLNYLPEVVDIYGVVITKPDRDVLSEQAIAHADALADFLKDSLNGRQT